MKKNILLFVVTVIAFNIELKADTLSVKTIYDTVAIDLVLKYQVSINSFQKNGFCQMIYKGSVLMEGNYKNEKRNGEWVFKGMNDTIQEKGSYVNGEKNGEWISYYSNGKASCFMYFKNGLKDGVFKGFYKDGSPAFEKTYISGLVEGIATYYYPNGKISVFETFLGDSLNGLAKEYYENGVLKEEKYMKGVKRDSVYKFYYEDGTLWEHIFYKNGNEYNVIAYNSPDGKPLNCCTLKDGNGIMRFYDKEGKLTSEKSLKNSMKDGSVKYFEKGILTTEGLYKENKYHGLWTENYETGELYSQINYTDDKKSGKATFYFKDGKVSQYGDYKDNEREGVWRNFGSGSELQSEITYSGGKYNGEAAFYSKGKIVNSGTYLNGVKTGYWKFFNEKGRVSSQINYGDLIVSNEGASFEIASEKEKNEVFTILETMPEFPGGVNMMMDFIRKNIVFPGDAKESGISGTVYVNFTIDITGEITSIKILRGVYSSLDKEALRVVKSMPKWSIGLYYGRPVQVLYNLPIKYTVR